MNEELDKLRRNLESLGINELRKMASANYGLKLTRDHSKDDIINTIVGMSAKGNYAQSSDGELQPGWARIKLASTNDYRSQFPVHVNANGYECKIPFGVEVDVPIRVIESLKNAVEFHVYQNEFGERAQKYSDSYPFAIIAICDGPDPRPGIEVARDAKQRPRKRFREQFGYWPTDKVFRDFVQSGMFQLKAEEHVVK